jgi:cobalt-zinc-cadmium efflux system protein
LKAFKSLLKALKAIEGVKSIHDFHVWSLDGENHVGSLHVVIEANGSPENIKELIRSQLKTEGLNHVTIELENPGEACGLKQC